MEKPVTVRVTAPALLAAALGALIGLQPGLSVTEAAADVLLLAGADWERRLSESRAEPGAAAPPAVLLSAAGLPDLHAAGRLGNHGRGAH